LRKHIRHFCSSRAWLTKIVWRFATDEASHFAPLHSPICHESFWTIGNAGDGYRGILLTLLLDAVFTFGSLNVPFESKDWRARMPLIRGIEFITAAFCVGLISRGTVLRLWVTQQGAARRALQDQGGVGAMAISLLPIIFDVHSQLLADQSQFCCSGFLNRWRLLQTKRKSY